MVTSSVVRRPSSVVRPYDPAMDCIFCAIVAGAAPASVVIEDDLTVAFMDISPVNPGHVLVVPKEHATGLGDLPEPTGARMMETAMRIAASIRSGPQQPDGINLFLADGVAAGQEVFHVHLHVVPRHVGDGFRLQVAYGEAPSRAELDEVAKELRSGLRE